MERKGRRGWNLEADKSATKTQNPLADCTAAKLTMTVTVKITNRQLN
jgi:hypothetical protein